MFCKILLFISFGTFFIMNNVEAQNTYSKKELEGFIQEWKSDIDQGKSLSFLRYSTEFITESLSVIDKLIAEYEPKIKAFEGKLQKISKVLQQDPDLRKYGDLMLDKLDHWNDINETMYAHRITLHLWLKNKLPTAHIDYELSNNILDAVTQLSEDIP